MRKALLSIVCLLLSAGLAAKESKRMDAVCPLPPEQEVQFKYYFYAAKSAIESEDYPQALMLFLFCEQINPQDGQTLDYLGLISDALGKKQEASAYFRQAYAANPRDLWLHHAMDLMKQADTVSVKERKVIVKQVISIVEQATKDAPKDTERWNYLRQAYLCVPNIRKALAAQDQIDNLIGYNAYSAANRYQIYMVGRQPKKAIAAIDQYLETDPTNLRFLLFKTELLDHIGAPVAERIEVYNTILSIDPTNTTILNNYAYLLATSGGDLKEAERMSQRTIQAQPENPVFLDTYAWILHLQGQDMLAAFYIRKALENCNSESDKTVIQAHYDAIIH